MDLYLDNAATSYPKPPGLAERLKGHLESFGGCPGRGSYELARRSGAMVDETRVVLAELFHASDPQRIIFTLNATDALNMAIKGVLAAGDHVVTTVLEHNSVARPLNAMEHRGMIRVTRLPVSREGLLDPDDVRRAITPRTKLVAIIHGSNVLGSLQPIEAIGRIARERGPLFLVDAAQTAGAVPIDIEACAVDLLAFPGHKALLGPPGTGGLYVGPRAEVAPWREGGTGVMSDLPLQPTELPMRLESGSLNTLGIAGLRESARFLLREGIERVRRHEARLTQRLLDGLRADERFTVYGPAALEERIAVVSMSLAGCPPDRVGAFLSETRRIAVRTGLHCAPGAHQVIGTRPHGTVRVSPGYFTTPNDIDACLAALHDAAETLPQRVSRHVGAPV